MLEVREIRVNTTTREVALFAPNGHPVDPQPWLVIATQDPLEPGFHWMSEQEVTGPEWQPLDWLGLPVPTRLGDLLATASCVDETAGSDVHGEGNHRCRCGKLELQASEGCEWHAWRVERGAKLRPPMCSDCIQGGEPGYALSNLSLDPEHWSNQITFCSVGYLKGPKGAR